MAPENDRVQLLSRVKGTPGGWLLPGIAVLLVSTLLYLGSIWLDALSVRGTAVGTHPFTAILHQNVQQARQTLGGLGEMMAAVLGLALTVSSIIVQLAATRFTPHVTTLFFRSRTNILTWGFFVLSTIFVIWVNSSITEQFVPRFSVVASLALLTISLALLFPYFGYVFHFLDPGSIIGLIMEDGLRASRGSSMHPVALADRKARATAAIERLANIGLNAMQQREKNIASRATDALCQLSVAYATTKRDLAAPWFAVDGAMRHNADFSSLSPQAIEDLETRNSWVEWKVLRQFQMLFGESLVQLKDLAHLIATDTRVIGVAAAKRRDFHALDLTIKFFNTYLRASINHGDIRTTYNVLHQYRQLAETALRLGQADDELGRRAIQVAEFFGYYSDLASEHELSFVVEVIAHDLAELCALAHELESPGHEPLLACFLAVDDPIGEAKRRTSLHGVRRAQAKLATTYILRDAESFARQIQHDMASEPPAQLRRIQRQLESLDTAEFWEVNDRGTNFDYLTSEQKGALSQFFSWFPRPDGAPDSGTRQRP